MDDPVSAPSAAELLEIQLELRKIAKRLDQMADRLSITAPNDPDFGPKTPLSAENVTSSVH